MRRVTGKILHLPAELPERAMEEMQKYLHLLAEHVASH